MPCPVPVVVVVGIGCARAVGREGERGKRILNALQAKRRIGWSDRCLPLDPSIARHGREALSGVHVNMSGMRRQEADLCASLQG